MVFCGALTGFAEIEQGWRGGRHTESKEAFAPRIPAPCEPLCTYAYVSAAWTCWLLYQSNWFKSWFWSINTWFKLVLLISFCFGILVFVFSEAISIGRWPLKYVAKYSLYPKFGTTFLSVQRMHCTAARFLSNYMVYMHLFRLQLLKFWFRTWQIFFFSLYFLCGV